VTSDAIYVDGAVTENVPARLAHHLGANLVIATNPLPPPSVLPPSRFFSRTLYELNPFFRLDQFMASIELMFHSVGDEEAEGYICYDPPPSSFPLFGTFDFKKARSIYENVRREAEFQATIDKAQKRWDRLARARTGAV
jgi:predicted acylesterase/phospholipase RssA